MDRPEQTTEEYKKWRKAVYVRDGFKCICCGRNSRLHAHHLDGWNWAIDKRFRVDNGVSLCGGKRGCHEKFHEMYGKGDNTKQQFEKFLYDKYRKQLNPILGINLKYDKFDIETMINDL